MRIGPLYGTATKGIGFFRLFGWGIHWKDPSRHPLLFSERYGYERPSFTVRGWWFTFLRRGRNR